MLEMSVNSIRVGPGNGRLVMLKERDSDRYLPILMSDATAYAIATKLKDLSITRPSTHDLLHTVIDILGGQVKHILVSDLQDDTYYSKIVIQSNGDDKEIDSRTSDAIALVVRSQVPIYVEEAVLEKANTG